MTIMILRKIMVIIARIIIVRITIMTRRITVIVLIVMNHQVQCLAALGLGALSH